MFLAERARRRDPTETAKVFLCEVLGCTDSMTAARYSVFKKLKLTAITLLVCGVVLEIGCRIWLHSFATPEQFRRYATIAELRTREGRAFAAFERHRHLGFAPTPLYSRAGTQHNRFGFRGPEPTRDKPAGTLRVVCVGGSTTYGWGTRGDGTATYPRLLEQALRRRKVPAEVLNMGCPGWTTLASLINFETRGLDFSPDYIIVYHGMNDALSRKVWPHDFYRGDLSGWLARTGFEERGSPWDSSTALRILRVSNGADSPASMQRVVGRAPPSSYYLAFREQRRAGTYPSGIFATVPLETMFATNPPIFFERNLRNLVATARAHKVGVVLSTFVVSSLFPNDILTGHPAIRAAIAETNAIVRRVARELDCGFLDMARYFPNDPKLLTDGMHFTAAGNAKRVDLTFEHVENFDLTKAQKR